MDQVMSEVVTNQVSKRALSDNRIVSMPVKPENIFHFPAGLPAFENAHDFVFLCPDDYKPFFIMQSLSSCALAFVCIDPFCIYPGYAPTIEEADVKALALTGPQDVFLFAIVAANRDVRKTTANLRGPVVVNIRTGIGSQILCSNCDYPMQYPLWEAASKIQNIEQFLKQPAAETTPKHHILWPEIEHNDKLQLITK
jgi:flagellar assembly factor FliW